MRAPAQAAAAWFKVVTAKLGESTTWGPPTPEPHVSPVLAAIARVCGQARHTAVFCVVECSGGAPRTCVASSAWLCAARPPQTSFPGRVAGCRARQVGVIGARRAATMGTAASRFASSGRRVASSAGPSGSVNGSIQVQGVWVPATVLVRATGASASRAFATTAAASRCTVAAAAGGSDVGAAASRSTGHAGVATVGSNARWATTLAAVTGRSAAVVPSRRQRRRGRRGRMSGGAAVAAGVGMLGIAVGMCAPAVAMCEGDEAASADAPDGSGTGGKGKDRSLFSAEVLENAGLPNPGGFGDLKRSSKLQFQPFDGFVAELTKSFAGEEGQLQIAQKCVARVLLRAAWCLL